MRTVFLSLPLAELDRAFVPDDTWYTLSVARSMASGAGPIADSLHRTNGFQPLIAFLLVPFYALPLEPMAFLRIAAALGAAFDAAAALLLARLAAGSWGARAGLAAGWLWALSPIAVANALCGLETSLALALTLASALAAGRALESGGGRALLISGGLAGLAMLARIDSAFLCALIGFAILRRRGWLAAARVAGVALLVVSPWWGYELLSFGTVIPESGPAVQLQASIHRAFGLGAAQQVIWALGYWLLPVFDPQRLRDALLTSALGAATLAAALCAALWWLVRPALRDAAPALRLFAGAAVLVTFFYALGVPAVWFFKRYLAPAEAVAVLALGWLVARCGRSFERRAAWLALVALALAPGALQLGSWALTGKPEERGLHGVKGYAEPARAVLDELERRDAEAVLGGFQTGALAYFAPPGIRVVNLDGVVNRDAYRALRERRIFGYVRATGIEYLADWGMNLSALGSFDEDPGAAGLRIEFAAPERGGLQMLLARVVWRDAGRGSGAERAAE